LVGFALLIDQEREGDSGFFAECAGVGRITEPNRSQSGSPFQKGGFVRAQLRDVLTAEDSTVVAQENNNCWLAKPERANNQFAAVAVRQADHRDATVQGGVHVKHFGRGTPPVKAKAIASLGLSRAAERANVRLQAFKFVGGRRPQTLRALNGEPANDPEAGRKRKCPAAASSLSFRVEFSLRAMNVQGHPNL